MERLILLIALTVFTSTTYASTKVIYGDDNRVDVYASTNSDFVELSKSTATQSTLIIDDNSSCHYKKDNGNFIIESIDDFCRWIFKVMRNLYVDKIKKTKESEKPIDDNQKIEDINSISEEYTEGFNDEYSENYNEEYTEYNTEEFSLTYSLNNIEVYDFFTAFSSFREEHEDCHELISAREFEPKLPYKEIKEQDRFVNESLENLRKMKERCMDSLKDFINNYYPKLAL